MKIIRRKEISKKAAKKKIEEIEKRFIREFGHCEKSFSRGMAEIEFNKYYILKSEAAK